MMKMLNRTEAQRLIDGSLGDLAGFSDEEKRAYKAMAEMPRGFSDFGHLCDTAVNIRSEFITPEVMEDESLPDITAEELQKGPDALDKMLYGKDGKQ
jgi:hypothetical protein